MTEIEKITAERDSLRQLLEEARTDLEAAREQLGSARWADETRKKVCEALIAVCDALRQQLESAQAEVAHPCIHNPCSRCIEYESVMGQRSDRTHFGEVSALVAVRRDLAAAQQRIAELEEIKNRQALHITHLVMQLRGHDWSDEVVATRARIAELEQHVDAAGRELKLQDATLRAIAPVYRAAWYTCRGVNEILDYTLSTARASLTPELLAVIEAATK